MSGILTVIVLSSREELESEKLIETLESLDGDQRIKVNVVYKGDSGLTIEDKDWDLDLKVWAGDYKSAIKRCETKYITFLKPGDIIDSLELPDETEDREILLGTLDGEYETGSTYSLAELLYESKILPRDLRGIIFNLDKTRLLGETELEIIVSAFYGLRDLDSPSYYTSWGRYEYKGFHITSGNIIEHNDPGVIEDCKKAWSKIEFSKEIRELLWNRMARTAVGILEYNPEAIEEYLVYLKRENKLTILN